MLYSDYKEPFNGYGWHWGAATPTESFNRPDIFYGCLKVLFTNQGGKTNSKDVYEGLCAVEADLNIVEPKLARTLDRNLFRNSGQYWKNLGVLETTTPEIKLTDLGILYATGKITKDEFACYTVKKMSLPREGQESPNIIEKWNLHGLKIKPLELLLKVLTILFNLDEKTAYLTPNELIRVIIPLSGHNFSVENLVKAILSFRSNEDDFSETWHPVLFNKDGKKNNNTRIAREFLYFLNKYGFLESRDSQQLNVINDHQEFYIPNRMYYEAIVELLQFDINSYDFDLLGLSVAIDKESQFFDRIRDKKLIEVTSRPKQAKFRKDVIEAAGGKCLITGITTTQVLQACHIKPVSSNGSDDKSNGILLRVDLHILFDKGHLSILESGVLELSEYLSQDPYYKSLIPNSITLPAYVDKDALRKRNMYADY